MKKDSVCFIRGPFLKGAQMEKKMRNILIALIIGFQVFPITVYGKGKDAFSGVSGSNAENSRVRKLERRTGYGCRYDNYPGKSKNENEVTLDAVTEVSGYDENDSSAVQMTGSASMAVLGQNIYGI